MSAIFKREFKTFFTSPIGYFVLAVLFGFSGFYFFATNMYAGSADLSGVFGGLFTIVLLLVLPVLTMRLLSDDKRQRTDQALLTAPVSLTGIALGKFLAALLLFAIGISITLVFAVIIAFQVTPDWLVIVGNYVGLLLLGGMVIAIGLFISSLTESQFIAALGTFVVSFAMIMVDSLGGEFHLGGQPVQRFHLGGHQLRQCGLFLEFTSAVCVPDRSGSGSQEMELRGGIPT